MISIFFHIFCMRVIPSGRKIDGVLSRRKVVLLTVHLIWIINTSRRLQNDFTLIAE